jgi:hypothetical protein
VIGLLQILVIGLDLAGALAGFVVFARPDTVVAVLAWGWRPSGWRDGVPLDDDEVDLLCRAVERLRLPAAVAVGAFAFGSGALLALLRLRSL